MEKQEKNQYYTNFVEKNEFIDMMSKASLEFVNSLSKDIHYENEALNVSIADGFSYIDIVAKKHGWHDVIRKIFLQCWSHAESSIVSSGNIAVYFLAQEFLEKNNKELLELTKHVVHSSSKISFYSLSQVLENQTYNFIKEVIKFGGINGNISIRKTESSVGAIELQAGHDFLVGVCSDFISEKEERSEAKIVLFDGIIENVGEVDRIFTECHEKKLSCVLVARKFSNDVIATINKNYLRNTLDVIPVKIDDSVENINLLNDLSACVGDNVISAETGVRLSNIDISEQPTINDVRITRKHFKFAIIEEHKDRVASRIESIKKRISKAYWDEEMTPEDITKVFVPRLNSLSSNSIILWSPGNERYQLFIKNRFLFSLNYIAAFANSGAIKTSDVINSSHNLPSFLPANIVDLSKALSKKMYSAISNSGGCVAIQ